MSLQLSYTQCIGPTKLEGLCTNIPMAIPALGSGLYLVCNDPNHLHFVELVPQQEEQEKEAHLCTGIYYTINTVRSVPLTSCLFYNTFIIATENGVDVYSRSYKTVYLHRVNLKTGGTLFSYNHNF